MQVEDYLYAKTSNSVSAFEKFLHEQFYIGSTEQPLLNMMGIPLDVDASGAKGIDDKKKLDEIEALVSGAPGTNDRVGAATEREVTA